MKKIKIVFTVFIAFMISAMLINFLWTSFNTFSMKVASIKKTGAYIIESDLNSQGNYCVYYYIYQVESKYYAGNFSVAPKDCEYKHKIREKIIIKHLLRRPWVSRFFSKDYDNKGTQVPLYVDIYLKNH